LQQQFCALPAAPLQVAEAAEPLQRLRSAQALPRACALVAERGEMSLCKGSEEPFEYSEPGIFHPVHTRHSGYPVVAVT